MEPPLWLGLIAGYRKSLGEDVVIIDSEAEGLDIHQTVKQVESLKPDEIMIVVMGNNPSVSSTPKMVVTEELLKYLPNAKLTGLHPIAVNYPGVVRKPFVGLPSVPWDMFQLDLYRAHNWHCLDNVDERSPYAVLYTSLNCPFVCSYCNIHTLYGNRKIQYRPLEDIYKEISDFYIMGVRNIKIWDELFCMNEERVTEICDYIIDNGYDFNIWAYGRVDTVSAKMLRRMKKAGINWIAYGFESADDEVRKIAHKGYKDSYRAIIMTKDAGINIMGNFIFGLPGDTIESMQANLDMAIQQNFEYVNFYVALPYPGSEWYENLKVKPVDWSRFDQFSPKVYADPKVVRFRDEAFKKYFVRPEYLKMIQERFGVRAVKHIIEMTEWKFR